MKNWKPILAIIFFCSAICGGAYYLINQKSMGGEHTNSVDLTLGQYSGRNITKNAQIQDLRFKNISFAPPQDEDSGPMSNLASIAEAIKFLLSKPKTVSNHEYGVWIWTPTLQMTPEYMLTMLNSAKREGLNTVYLSIDSYLDIYKMAEGPEKAENLNRFNQTLETFIKLAGDRGIAVDAEAGWKNWAEDGHTYKPFTIVSFVKNYNNTHAYKFRGFQYDVEPYLLDNYRASDEGKMEVLTEYVRLVSQTVDYLADSDLKFSIVVPDFYDKKDKMTPQFVYAGKKDYVFKHLLRVLEKKPESTIIVMSYRNFAEGKDGSIEVSKNEMQTAEYGMWSTNIVLAQETGDVPPSYITFHNTSKNYFRSETEKLRNAFLRNPNFGGMAVHYANAFMSLK